MKKFFFILILLIFSGTVYAQESVTLAWTPSVSPNIIEYRVYQSLIPNIFALGAECNAIAVIESSADCPTKAVISNLKVNYRYYFVVTAVNSDKIESSPSNEISISIQEESDPLSEGPTTGILVTFASIGDQ